MDTHKCPAPDCDRDIRSSMYACRAHWRLLPKPLRDAIWSGYNEQPLGEAHVAAMQEAQRWFNEEHLTARGGVH